MQDLNICWLTGTSLPRYLVTGKGAALNLVGLTAEALAKACNGAAPDVVVVPPVSAALQAAAWARDLGAKVVIDCHDSYFDTPASLAGMRQLLTQAHAVSAASPGLAALAKEAGRAAVQVNDPCLDAAAEPRFAPSGDRALRLTWTGDAGDLGEISALLSDLIAYAQQRPVSLAIVGSLPGPLADSLRRVHEVTGGRMTVSVTEWSEAACRSALADCDAVLLPTSPDDRSRIRSASRLTQALRAGRLVVAGPVSAYAAFDAGIMTGNPLSSCLYRAEQDVAAARQRIATGQALVEAQASPAAVTMQWAAVFQAARDSTATAPLIAMPQGVRFNLGCGDKILPGYINCDALASRGQGGAVDVQCNITKPLPFADNIASEVLAVHVVEHIWRWEVIDVLRDWRRVIQPGGQIILECPNLLSAAMELVKNPALAAGPGPEGQRSMWVFYGDPRWRDPLMNHCWGYTPQSLAALLSEAGFVDVRQEPAQFKLREPRDMRIVGVKPA